MPTKPQPSRIHLPKGWQDCVKSAGEQASCIEGQLASFKRA